MANFNSYVSLPEDNYSFFTIPRGFHEIGCTLFEKDPYDWDDWKGPTVDCFFGVVHCWVYQKKR